MLFASSVHSLITPAPQFGGKVMGEGGGECDQDAPKSNFTSKCLNAFVAHCSLGVDS